MPHKKISVIIPVYNEEENVPLIWQELEKAWKYLPQYERELIFVDDGSTDGSADGVRKLRETDGSVRLVAFTRNFGKEIATTAGIHAATGDAAIMIDADLQHPAELIPQFVAEWEKGAEVVVGIRTKNKNEGLLKRFGSAAYYRLMTLISETKLRSGETDFRLLDRAVIDAFNEFTERERITRALVNWLGFRREYIEFEANERANGRSPYSFLKLLHLATHSFISHSLIPLRLAGYLGMVITFLSGLLGVAVFFERYVLHDPLHLGFSGSAQLAILNVFLIGIVLISLGLIALYIGTIQGEVTNRPMYVLRKERQEK